MSTHDDAWAALQQRLDELEALVRTRDAELRIAREAAHAADHARRTFLANTSHELRSPISGIIGMTRLALRLATDPAQVRQLELSLQASAELLATIDNILALAHLESTAVVLEPRRFSLAAVLLQVAQQHGPLARAKGLHLSVEGLDALPGRLLGDAARLQDVVDRLVSNAVKFSSQGQIVLRARVIEQDSRAARLRLEVSDEGIGIAEQDRARLFQAFTQLDDSLTRRHHGTGLGLAIAGRLVAAMGGQIGVDSEPGRGSCFWVTVALPLAEDHPASGPDVPATPPGDALR